MIDSATFHPLQPTAETSASRFPATRPCIETGAADDIRSLRYGITALRLAQGRSGLATGELAAECRISRAAAYRVLNTLAREGYMLRIGSLNRSRYRLAPRVRELARGYAGWVRVLDVAVPVMLAWTREFGWPLALSTPTGHAATVRYTTDGAANRALTRYRAGGTCTALDSASGLLCLAHAPPDVALDFATRVAAETRPDSCGARTQAELLARLSRVRRQGFALFQPQGLRETTLAIPIWQDGIFAASLALRYMRVVEGGPSNHARRLAMLGALRERIVERCDEHIGNDELMA